MTDVVLPITVSPRTPIGDAFKRASAAYDKWARSAPFPLSEHPTFELEVWRDGMRVVARGSYVDRQHPECGSDTGYYYHRRKYGTDACAACKRAHADAEAARKKRVALRARGDAA